MFEEIKANFEKNADPKQAKMLKKYMRDQFEFYGLHTPIRRNCYHEFLKEEKKTKKINWNLLNLAWSDEHRESQYFVCDYLITMQKYISYEDMPKIEKFVRSKQWWDTIDSLIKPIGKLGLRDKQVNDLMLKWSLDSNIWVKRVAIEHQLLRKDKMNTILLEQILLNNLDSDEFFINKAIGWALRDYSKTNPDWVKSFVKQNQNHLASLSIKEGCKYL